MKNIVSEKRLAKINLIWQCATGVLAPVLVTVLFLIFPNIHDFSLFRWLLWLHLPLLMFHEFEEYIFPGGFKLFFNTYITFSKEKPTEDNLPINEKVVFIINIALWVWIVVGALLAGIAPWIGVGAMILQLINVVGHIYIFQIKKLGYNPGLITAMFLLIPYMVVLIWVSIIQSVLSPLEWIFAFLMGFVGIGTILMIGKLSSGKSKE